MNDSPLQRLSTMAADMRESGIGGTHEHILNLVEEYLASQEETEATPDEVWYAWKEYIWDGHQWRYITPWADPDMYEYPFDYLFHTPEEAIEIKNAHDEARDEDWVLVRVMLERVSIEHHVEPTTEGKIVEDTPDPEDERA